MRNGYQTEMKRKKVHFLVNPPLGQSLTTGKTKKAADIPKPPRHDETIKTFEKVVENLSELMSVSPLMSSTERV